MGAQIDLHLTSNIYNMKKIYLVTILVGFFQTASFAQEAAVKNIASTTKEFKALADTVKKWDIGGAAALNFGQTYLSNWAGGGQNAISVAFNGTARANYRKDKWAWDNSLILSVGGIALFPQGKYSDPGNGYPFRKNIDNLQLTSAGGYQIDKGGKWFVSALLDFRTQLLRGYDNYRHEDTLNGLPIPVQDKDKINARDKVSEFAAPAYLTVSAGITYKPYNFLTFYLAPVAGKFTFVNPAAGVDETRYGLAPGKIYRPEFGWYFRGSVEKEVFKNVIVKSQVELFMNYLDKSHVDNLATVYKDETDPSKGTYYSNAGTYDNRKNVDVNWQTWITFKINKYLQASLEWQLIYDYDIAVPKYKTDGVASYQGRGVQFREGFNLGLGYMF